MKILKYFALATVVLISPKIALAQCAWEDQATGSCSFANFVDWAILGVLRPVIPLLVSLTAAFFLWGVAQYIMNGSDPKARTDGRQKMIWGIIGLAVMLSFWAIARGIRGTFF